MKIQLLNRAPVEVEQTWEGVTRKRSQQWCVLEIDGLPTAFHVTCDPGKELPPGQYTLDPKSFNVQNGRLTIQRVVLAPVEAHAKAKAA